MYTKKIKIIVTGSAKQCEAQICIYIYVYGYKENVVAVTERSSTSIGTNPPHSPPSQLGIHRLGD